MKRYITLALVAGFTVAACKDNPTVPPSLDAPPTSAITSLTMANVIPLTLGVLAQDRAAYASTAVLTLPSILARDVYRIDASEPRYVGETLGGQADPGSFAGGGGFATFYTAIRAERNMLNLLKANPPDFSAQENAAMRGLIRTMMALDYYRVIELRDTVGIPLQSEAQLEITPIYCKPHVLNYVASLLDSANADFTAAGPATVLPGPQTLLPGGWSDFGRNYNVVSNLVLLNRGLKGKVDFYRAINRASPQPSLLPTAIAELTQALGGAAPGAVSGSLLQRGVYYRFDPVIDQFRNLRSDPKIAANPHLADSVVTDSIVRKYDTRSSKIVSRARLAGQGLSSTYTFSFAVPSSANQIAPIPLLKDEELVLLRAQAEIEAGLLAEALLDINAVHNTYNTKTTYTLADLTPIDAARKVVLFEKRLSLLFEGPQRLVDLRAYGYLNATHFVAELATDPFNNAFPIPRAELNARGLTTNPVCTP